MKLAMVAKTLAPCRAAAALGDRPLLLLRSGQEELAAVDLVGAAQGDWVLAVTGCAGAKFAMDTAADAVVVAVIPEDSGIGC